MKKILVLTFLACLCVCSAARADELSELKEMMKTMQAQMSAMQSRIEQLEEERSEQVMRSEGEIDSMRHQVDRLTKEGASSGGLLAGLGNFNPDISVMGDFVYKASDLDGAEGNNDFNMREVELAFSANVDTWARADFYVAIENEDSEVEVALEEGYLTLLETPIDNLQGKFGKFRPKFGKANEYHLHNMAWVDYPKFIQTYFGEEGFSEAGASLSYLIDNPWDIYSELTLQAVNNADTVLGGGEDGETLYITHLKEFFDITENQTLEIGGSYMFGENANASGNETSFTGVDLTYKWQDDAPGSYKKVTWQSEFLFQDKETAGDDSDTWGMYSSLEHQFAKQWKAFTRYDFFDDPDDSALETHAYSAGLTFMQSEYAFWRIQYQHNDNAASADEDVVWLQLDFGIGPHRAHEY